MDYVNVPMEGLCGAVPITQVTAAASAPVVKETPQMVNVNPEAESPVK